MANSEPVVIASDQSAIPVSATNLDIRDLTSADTVTANLSATDNAVLDAIEADTTIIAGAVSGTEMQVDVLTMPTVTVNAHAVTNAGTFVVQENGAALTALQLLDNTVYTDGTGTVTAGIAILGQDGTNPQAIHTDATGDLQVDVLTMPIVAVSQSGTWDEVGINDSGNSITVDNGGTFAVQSTNQANSGVDIGDVTINNAAGASAVNIQDGGNSLTVD